MIVTILLIIITIIITAIICYFIPKGKINKENQTLLEKEQQIQLKIKDTEKEYSELVAKFNNERQAQALAQEESMRAWEKEKSNKNLSFLQAENKLKEDIANLNGQIEEKKKSLNELDTQAKEAINLIEEQIFYNMSNNIETEGKKLTNNYEKLESELLLHYVDLNDSKWDEYIARSEELDNKILQQENTLQDLEKKAEAITESNKRAELEREQKDFYRLQLSQIDIEEIKRIRSIEPYLRKKEPLNKVIWKVYYEKPYNDLIGRVVGQTVKKGIYKITHIDSGKCYVGQSVDIAERWRQHIKRGIGADPPTQNKLYPAMLEEGAENFMFEIIEECSTAQLSEREKYYTDIYNAQSYGYVARKG